MTMPRLFHSDSPTGTFEGLSSRALKFGLLEWYIDCRVLEIILYLLLTDCYVVLFLVSELWRQLVVAVTLVGDFVKRRIRKIVEQSCSAHEILSEEVQVWTLCATMYPFLSKVSSQMRLEAMTL